MMSLMTISFLMMSMMTPIKMAMTLVVLSVYISAMCYQESASIFCSSAIVISFSSGMMIILCYTAMMSNFESKSKMSMKMMLPTAIALMIMCNKKLMNSNVKENTTVCVNSMMIVILMLVVLCAMKSINQSVFSPQKAMVSTY